MEELRYGDEVIVIAGFYKGCTGFVLDCEKLFPGGELVYDVEVQKYIGTIFRTTIAKINESCLKINKE